MKIILFGLDGASYDLINKFAAKNDMPNFKRLIENGHFRRLESTTPPHTAPGWTTAFTGVGPGKHGIYQFWDTQAQNYVGKFMGRDDYGVLPVWDILNKVQLKTSMINIPMTYPPREVNGLIITWPLSNTLRYAYPNDILFEIARYGGHFASDINSMYDGDLNYIDKAIDITSKRLKTLEYVIQNCEWDFLASVFTEIDRISHFYWHFMDKTSCEYIKIDNKKFREAVEKIYIETDRILGKILEMLPDDGLVLTLSDHGFGKGEINFYIQSFLMENSLLTITKTKDNRSNVGNQRNETSDIISNSWFECFCNEEKYTVNWSKTVAYMSAPGSYGINVNLKGRQEFGIIENDYYEEIRDMLINLLSKVTHPHNGSKLFKKVARREEVYTGENLHKAPDLILIPENYSVMVHHKIIPGVLFGSPEHKGMHNKNGIIGVYGKAVDGKKLPFEIKLEDITPTILSYFGVEIPNYMDGKPFIEFAVDSIKKVHIEECDSGNGITKTNINNIYTEKERIDVEQRLKSMGYL